MSLEENKAIFRGVMERLWNQGDLSVADELVAPDAFSPSMPQLPSGPEGFKQIATTFRAAFPDLNISIEDLIAEDDLVAGRLIERATHRGEFMGIPATGKAVTINEIGIFRIAHGKIAETWFELDVVGLLQQLGVVPTPGQSAPVATAG